MKNIEKSKYLVGLLEKSKSFPNFTNDLDKLENKIKSKIYGDYAIYRQYSFHKYLNEISLKNNINRTLSDNNTITSNSNKKFTIKRTLSIGVGKKQNQKSVNVSDLRNSVKLPKKK